MKKHISTIILIFVFLVGLSVLLYPMVSNYWNSIHQSRAIDSYVEVVDNMDEEVYEKLLKSAHEYNKKLFQENHDFNLSEDEVEEYESQLKIEGSDIMAYIAIEKIDCYLPIYHGTDDSVLQVAIGHIEGSSLPVGGKSTHCVLSGHRGLPSAQLFSKLDELEVGDKFVITTLNETLTYEVDKISIVLPNEVDGLRIVEGEDLCTLVTCTPYGINTHRLLVRGHRVPNDENAYINVTSEAFQITPIIVASVIAVPMLIALLCWLLFHTKKTSKRGNEDENS